MTTNSYSEHHRFRLPPKSKPSFLVDSSTLKPQCKRATYLTFTNTRVPKHSRTPASCARRPAALHSLGCSAEEITAALERRRTQETEEAVVKKAEEKTNLAELDRRAKDAKNPPKPTSTESKASSSSSGGGSSSSSGDAASK